MSSLREKRLEILQEMCNKHEAFVGTNFSGVPLEDFYDHYLDELEAVDSTDEISLCPHCFCMTKNICAKCKKVKATTQGKEVI